MENEQNTKKQSIAAIIFLAILSILFIAGGLLLLFSGINKTNEYDKKDSSFIETTSIVVEHDSNSRGLHAIVVEYEVEGKKYKKTSNRYSKSPEDIGEEVLVKYNSQNPWDAMLKEEGSHTFFSIPGLMLFLTGTLIAVVVIKNRKKGDIQSQSSINYEAEQQKRIIEQNKMSCMSIEEVEALRKKAKKYNMIGFAISICLGIIGCVIFGRFTIFFFGLIIGIIITTGIIANKPTREFNLAFKYTFILRGLKSVFSDLAYDPERGLDESIISNTKMMYMGDRYSSNDYMKGKYKSINVEQADIHIEEKHTSTDSNGHTSTTWVTIFRGKWMIFDFNKKFKANIQVSQQGFRNSKISNFFEKSKYKAVQMEDQEFNNNFKIFAQEEHDAFYILTPSLMEKIKKISNTIDGKLLFCFIDNKLHIGNQNGKDSFEWSIYKKLDEERINKETSNDIKIITSFVDELNLDNDLFRKEV